MYVLFYLSLGPLPEIQKQGLINKEERGQISWYSPVSFQAGTFCLMWTCQEMAPIFLLLALIMTFLNCLGRGQMMKGKRLHPAFSIWRELAASDAEILSKWPQIGCDISTSRKRKAFFFPGLGMLGFRVTHPWTVCWLQKCPQLLVRQNAWEVRPWI